MSSHLDLCKLVRIHVMGIVHTPNVGHIVLSHASLVRPVTTFTLLSQMSIDHIFLLHVELSDLQDSIDASQELMSVMDEDVFTEIHDSNSSTSLAYRTTTRRQYTRFRRLLEEVRRSVAFFGYENMPPRQQFVDAVRQAQLYNERSRTNGYENGIMK